MRISALSGTNYNLYNNKAKQNISFAANQYADDDIFYKAVDKNLYRGRMPGNNRELMQLKDLGITKIVSFEDYLDYNPYDAKKLGIECNILPFQGIPNNEIIDSFFNIMDKAKENDEKVYAHCFFGRERTGLMVDLYKLHNNVSLEDNMDSFYSNMVYAKYLKSVNKDKNS